MNENIMTVEEEAESEWWIMQFDGVMNAYRNGSGRMIIFLCEKKILS
jgi:hypothetical protein